MKALKTIGLILLGIIVILCVYAAVLPSEYKVERSTVINADEASVWNGINKFASFKKWNPWGKLDTAMTSKIEGEDGSLGCVYSWDSKEDNVGAGSMTITSVEPMKTHMYDLKFTRPFESQSKGAMTMEKAEGGYKVTWSMSGEQNFMGKLFMIFMGGMDGAVGKDFEAGLAQLKSLTEGGAFKATDAAPQYTVSDYDYPATKYAAMRSKIAFKDLPAYFASSFGTIFGGIEKAGLKVSGTPAGIYYMYDEKAMMTDMAVAVPVDKEAKIDGVTFITVNAAKAHKIDYYGAYEKMMPAYMAMSNYLSANNLGSNPEMVIEEYVVGAETQKDTAQWHTRILFFTK